MCEYACPHICVYTEVIYSYMWILKWCIHMRKDWSDLFVCVSTDVRQTATGWRRTLQIIFDKRATKYRLLLWKMTYKDKGSYESSTPCIQAYVCICVCRTSILAVHLCDMTYSPVCAWLTHMRVTRLMYVRVQRLHICANICLSQMYHLCMCAIWSNMGWLRSVGSMKL